MTAASKPKETDPEPREAIFIIPLRMEPFEALFLIAYADQIPQVQQAHVRPLKGEYCSIMGIVPSLSRCFSITRIVMGCFESNHKV